MQPKPKINIIDFSVELNAIKNEFGRDYHKDNKAIRKAADLWGAETNGLSAVFKNYTTETLAEFGRCLGQVKFTHTTKGYWLIGINVCTAISGHSFAPSAWDRTGFKSYDDARLTGVYKLEDFFKRAKSSYTSRLHTIEIDNTLRRLEAEKTPQLNLF